MDIELQCLSMDESNRSVAKRQIARLLGGSSLPMYVLSEDDTLVFANEALARILDRPTESVLGLQCTAPIPSDGVTDAALLSWLAVPVDWTRQHIRVVPVDSERFPKLSEAGAWVKCMLPLESESDGCILCILCQTPEGSLELTDHSSGAIHRILSASRAKFNHLDSLWFLHGSSAFARRSLEQIQIAVSSNVPTIIVGPVGSGRTWLAQALHAKRSAGNSDLKIANSLIRIDCGLMDTDLLKSMFELIREKSTQPSDSPTVVLDALESLPTECFPMLHSYLAQSRANKLITTCSTECLNSQSDSQALREILLQASTLRIDLTSIEDRRQDLPALVVAWLSSEKSDAALRVDFTDGFEDAINAYAWPGDIEEFSSAMHFAIESACTHQATGDPITLTEKHLPVNIRTYVSYVEQTNQDEAIDLDSVLEDVERTMIMRALERFPNNKTSAAKILNISRARLLRRLQQWGVQVETETTENDDDAPIFKEVD